MNTISGYVSSGCTALTDVYYTGTEADWANITLNENGNDVLLNATMHYEAALPGAPETPDVPEQPEQPDQPDQPETKLTGDVDGDGKVGATDAALILQYAAYAGAGGEGTIEDFMATLG